MPANGGGGGLDSCVGKKAGLSLAAASIALVRSWPWQAEEEGRGSCAHSPECGSERERGRSPARPPPLPPAAVVSCALNAGSSRLTLLPPPPWPLSSPLPPLAVERRSTRP